MNSPWIGLLFQHGHITDVGLAKRLAAAQELPRGLLGAIRQLRSADTATSEAPASSGADKEASLQCQLAL